MRQRTIVSKKKR